MQINVNTVILSQERFSASTAPKETALALRVVHPETRPGQEAAETLRDAGWFFNARNLEEAKFILEKEGSGLESSGAFGFFIKQLTRTTTPQTPPAQTPLSPDQPTLGTQAGPFACLIPLHNFITKKEFGRRWQGTVPDTPKAPKKRRALTVHEGAAKRCRTDDDDSSIYGTSDEPRSESEPKSQTTGEVESMTAPEMLVVAFLTGLCGGIAVHLQPTTESPRYIAAAFEQTFRFGYSGADSSDYECGARIDGQLCEGLLRVPELGRRLCVSFEAKRDRVPSKGDWATQTQQALEHIAIISARHLDSETQTMTLNALGGVVDDHGVRDEHGHEEKGYSLLLSQRADQIYLSLASYGQPYLEYLARPEAIILPHGFNCSEKELLHLLIQEFGPFRMEVEGDLHNLATIIVALIVADMEAAGTRCFHLL